MKIKIHFLGAAENVTGSRHLLEINGYKILVDCGLYQERDFRDRNWDPFPIPPSEINAVLLTHAHLDHCGLLPKLVKEGFNGKVYCNEATAEIAKIVLLDAGHIQEEDAQRKKRRHKRKGYIPPFPTKPLYDVADAQACLDIFAPVKFKQTVYLADGLEVTFHDAGHILGSSMIKIKAKLNGDSRTIIVSGDIGRSDRPILHDPTFFEHADYVLIESTYGDRVHQPVADIKESLAEVINSTYKAGGNLVVPSFSVERAQELLYFVNELINEKKIPYMLSFLDSPMAIRVTEVFKGHAELFDDETTALIRKGDSPFEFPGLSFVMTSKESKAINNIKGTVMVIAGSGMCTGGRIKHHIVNNITRPESTLMFVGYQAFGTLGRRIVNGEKEVRVLGEKFKVKARVAQIHGFSGHADQNELCDWLAALKTPPRQVFVVHGEVNSAHAFAKHVEEKLGYNAIVPKYQQVITLD
jgi:metallo-beta-lactamase family protein